MPGSARPLEVFTDLEQALERRHCLRRRQEGWTAGPVLDEAVALRLGVLGRTTGAGAFPMLCVSIPGMLRVADAMQRCPAPG